MTQSILTPIGTGELIDKITILEIKAITDQIAACVYWPPFSRMPGGYALMYPGSTAA